MYCSGVCIVYGGVGSKTIESISYDTTWHRKAVVQMRSI